MNKHFTPAISEEKFAAWLDGMLPADEMNQIGSIIDNDSNLQSIIGASNAIDACIADEPLAMPDYTDNPTFSCQSEMMELPALESLPLSPIDVDFANGIFPTFIPDCLFPEETSLNDVNDVPLDSGLDDGITNL